MMKEIINVDFNRLAKQMATSEVFGDELIVSNLHKRRDEIKRLKNPPIYRLNAVMFLICTHGEIVYHIDYKDYHLHKNMFLQLNSIHVLSNARMSNDFDGYFVALSPKLAKLILDEMLVIKKLYVGLERSLRLIELSPSECNALINNISRINDMMKATNHSFKEYILKNETSNLLLEIANIYSNNNINEETAPEIISRKETVVQNFIGLVFDKCKEEHEVAYYSSKLCMTSGNLSRILKAVSGKTAIKWISDALVMEAKILLQNPTVNIQDISDELHFSCQTSFGKFFKKHTGQTPTEFKNRLKLKDFR